MGLSQNSGAFGHEMDTAKYNILGGLIRGRLLGESKRVSPKVAQVYDLFALVVVGENNQLFTQSLLEGTDPFDNRFSIQMIFHFVLRFAGQLNLTLCDGSKFGAR